MLFTESLKLLLFIVLLIFTNSNYSINDLTLVGPIDICGGLGQIGVGIIDVLHSDIKINHIKSSSLKKDYLSKNIIKVLKNSDKSAGKICLYYDHLFRKDKPYKKMPKSFIKIAYTMVEGNLVPKEYIEILNTYFDAVLVPDKYFIDIYKKSGVKKPVFEMPIGIYLERLLSKPIKQKANKIFEFTFIAGFNENRKNHHLLIKAFNKVFFNNPNICLRLHGTYGNFKSIQKLIKNYKLSNVKLTFGRLNPDLMVDLLSQSDCFVSFSKGEGYSIAPREAMALGIPCILSNNTAHQSICKTGLVIPVKSKILCPAYYKSIQNYCGFNYDVTFEDACKALKDVYFNYNKYLYKNIKAREWTKQFLWNNLKLRFKSLVKPKNITLGKKNLIEEGSIMTSCPRLYAKYKRIINDN